MIHFNFQRLFKLKGITKPFSHLRTLGYSDNYASKLANNRVKEINLDRLEKFCRDFNCTPNDILDFRPSKNNPLPEDHALHSLTKNDISDEIAGKIFSLPADKIEQIHAILKNMD